MVRECSPSSAHSGCSSSRSRRDEHTKASGASVESTTERIRSRKVCSAQWISSTTTMSGRSAASTSNIRATAQNVSSTGNTASIRPIAAPTRCVTFERSGPRSASSLARASSNASAYPIPAASLHDLGERPEGDAVAVRQTAPSERIRRVGRSLEERSEQPGLPDTGGADHGRELGPTVDDRAGERRLEGRQVIRSSHHRRVQAPGDRLSVFQTRDVGQEVGGNGLGLPLQVERFDRLGVDEVLHQPVGRGADQDLHRGRGRLQSCRRVDDVARDEVLAGRHIAGDHLAGVHARPVRELHPPRRLQPLVHPGQGRPHLPRRANRAECVVLVDPRAGRIRPRSRRRCTSRPSPRGIRARPSSR